MTSSFTLQGKNAVCNKCKQTIKGAGDDKQGWRKRSTHICFVQPTNEKK